MVATPLSPDTRNTLQEQFQDKISNLGIGTQLPETASHIKICNGDGLTLSYVETHQLRFNVPSRTQDIRSFFRTFYHVRRVILSLTFALEGEEKCREIDNIFCKNKSNLEFIKEETLTKFLETQFSTDSLVLSVLKCTTKVLITQNHVKKSMFNT